MLRGTKICTGLLALLAGFVYPSRAGAAASACTHTFGTVSAGSLCVSQSGATALARTAPFSEVDPTPEIGKDARLPLVGIEVGRYVEVPIAPPPAIVPFQPGPALDFWYRYGHIPAPQRFTQPPAQRATFFDVRESLEAESRGISLLRWFAPGPGLKRTGVWTFTADLDRHHVTLFLQSDGPKALVSRIGWGLVRRLRASRTPPSPQVRVYVAPPGGKLYVGRAATFWVAMDAGILTTHQGVDFAFRLTGGWSRPRTETPDGTQSCGGDNVAGQPFVRRGLWRFAWGDCQELGLVLRPTHADIHSITIYSYRVPMDARGMLDLSRERLEPGTTYTWEANVRG